MAYIQKPGRGNSPKTGNGIPSVLKQVDPNSRTGKTIAEYARKDVEGYTRDEMQKSRRYASGAAGTGDLPGTSYDSKTNQTAAVPYEKSLKTGKQLGLKNSDNDLFMVDGGNRIMERAGSDPEKQKKLKDKFEKNKADTDDSRSSNAYSQNKRASLSGGFNRRS